MLDHMKSLVLRKAHCVLATTDGQNPHSSLMAYIPGNNGTRLYLATLRETRKFQNIQHHSRVSLLIDTRDENPPDQTQALTVTGTCSILHGPEEVRAIKAAFVQRHPHLKDFILKKKVAVLCVQFESFQLLKGPEGAHYEILNE